MTLSWSIIYSCHCFIHRRPDIHPITPSVQINYSGRRLLNPSEQRCSLTSLDKHQTEWQSSAPSWNIIIIIKHQHVCLYSRFLSVDKRMEVWERKQLAKKNNLTLEEWLTGYREKLYMRCRQLRREKVLKAVWSTLIGRALTLLRSHWSRASLVMLAPAVLCYKEPARDSKPPTSD